MLSYMNNVIMQIAISEKQDQNNNFKRSKI